MKRIVLCCDGTWNRVDQERDEEPCPSNVVKIAYRIAKRSGGTQQIVYYDQGVGTGNVIDRFSGGAFGKGLDDNLFEAYRFLVANYEAGDEIYLFGFSRGAFTARSIAGMLRNCGILKRTAVREYRHALGLYLASDVHPNHPQSKKFRADHSEDGEVPPPIHLVGVWDTVGALGIPMRGLRGLTKGKYQFHDTELSSTVRHAYHALAIDERRAPFEPTLWSVDPADGQKVEQTWFCGVHSDIGGGYPGSECGLADITLAWMIEKARGAGLGFDDEVLAAYPLEPNPLATPHQSKKGLYRLTPGLDRPIGRRSAKRPDEEASGEDPTQSVDESVRRRWREMPDYRPPGLVDFFRRRNIDPASA